MELTHFHRFQESALDTTDLVLTCYTLNTLVKFTIIYYTIGLTTKSSPSCVNIKFYIKMQCGIYLFLNNVNFCILHVMFQEILYGH